MTDPDRHAAATRAGGVRPSPHQPALTTVQKSVLLLTLGALSAAVMLWNSLTGHVTVTPGFNGGLDPAMIARSSLDGSALHWISIRADASGDRIDFSPVLADAAALASLRYGVDQPVPDHVLPLPAKRDSWPLPPTRLGSTVITLPPGSRTVSVSVTYKTGGTSPVLIYTLPPTPP